MTVTERYSQIHDALAATSTRHGLTPFDARMLVAIDEAGGSARTDQLESTLRTDGSAVRRSMGNLRAAGFVRTTGPGGGRVKRGCRASLTLDTPGRETVATFRAHLSIMAGVDA